MYCTGLGGRDLLTSSAVFDVIDFFASYPPLFGLHRHPPLATVQPLEIPIGGIIWKGPTWVLSLINCPQLLLSYYFFVSLFHERDCKLDHLYPSWIFPAHASITGIASWCYTVLSSMYRNAAGIVIANHARTF